MKTLLESAFFLVALVASANADAIDFATVAENVQRHFLSRGIFVVYDESELGLDVEKSHVEAIRSLSAKGAMSRMLSYRELHLVPRSRENVLHSFWLDDAANLQRAINATRAASDPHPHPHLLWFREGNSNFDCDQPGEHFFRLRMDAKMMAKCHGSDLLKRYYGVSEDRTRVLDMAEWSAAASELVFEDKRSLHEIETDMRGITLRLAKRDERIQQKNENLANYLDDLMGHLASFGNFKTEVSARDSSVGYYDHETTHGFVGLIGLVERRKADIGVFLFSVSKSRLTAVDFAAPLTRARYYLYAKLPDGKVIRWKAYFEAFDLCTWISMGLSILVSAALLSLVKSRSPLSFPENFINVWGIYCHQGVADPVANAPTRIIYFAILISSLVLNEMYSATITSYITLLEPKLPFSTYDEFKLDKSHEVTIVKNGRDENLIVRHDDPYLAPLKPRLKIPSQRPVNPYEGFLQACEQPKTVFYSDDVNFDAMKKPPCQLGQVDMERFEHKSLILTKNSPYTRAISHFISRLRDHGLKSRLRNKYFYKFTEIPDNQPNFISWREISPILTVWIIGVLAASIVWLFELLAFTLTPVVSSRQFA